jgi:hypothetical protein
MQIIFGNESVSQQRPQGRRRADDLAEPPSTEPASFADLATMWRSVSQAHAVVAEHRRQFQNTPLDDRLAEQLSLVPVLHDWTPVTDGEVRELVYLLGLYAEPQSEASRDEVAHAVNSTVRQMAVRRAIGRRSD